MKTNEIIESLVREGIEVCGPGTNWQQHYWHQSLEQGTIFDGYMDDYDCIMEQLVEIITRIYTDWSRGQQLGGVYETEEGLIYATLVVYERLESDITGETKTYWKLVVEYEEDERSDNGDYDLELTMEQDEMTSAIMASIREQKLEALGI